MTNEYGSWKGMGLAGIAGIVLGGSVVFHFWFVAMMGLSDGGPHISRSGGLAFLRCLQRYA